MDQDSTELEYTERESLPDLDEIGNAVAVVFRLTTRSWHAP